MRFHILIPAPWMRKAIPTQPKTSIIELRKNPSSRYKGLDFNLVVPLCDPSGQHPSQSVERLNPQP